MIIAGWILAILGLAQVVFAGTIEVSQLTEGNRLIEVGFSPLRNVAEGPQLFQNFFIHRAFTIRPDAASIVVRGDIGDGSAPADVLGKGLYEDAPIHVQPHGKTQKVEGGRPDVEESRSFERRPRAHGWTP